MNHSKRTQPKISFVWLIGIVFCGVLLAAGCRKVNITEDEVRQRIKSGLPLGSNHSQVNDFLKAQNWNGDPKLSEFQNMGTLDNLLKEEEKRTIKWYSTGGIRDAEKTLFGGRTILMGFYYDEEGKLVAFTLSSYGYST